MLARLLILTAALTALATAPAAAATRAGIPAPAAEVIREACPGTSDDEVTTGICASDGKIYAPANASEFAVEHELGHLYDAQRYDAGERNKLQRLLGMPRGAWRTGTGLHGGLASPSERAADAYAACRMRMDPDRRWESAYDYQPTRKQFRRVCALIRRASDT